MTTEPQTDPLAELTLARADLKSADAHLLELEATMQPPVDLAALQAKLDALQVAYEAKQAEVKQQSAERQAWRKESWAWRKLAGVVHDKLLPLTAAEVLAKKFLGAESVTAPDTTSPIKGRDLSALTVSKSFNESQLSGDLLKWFAETKGDFAKAMPGSPASNPGLSDAFGSVLRGGIREAYSRVGIKYFRAMMTLFRFTGDKTVLDLVYDAGLTMMNHTGSTTFTIEGKTFVTWPTDIRLPPDRKEPNYLANKEAHSSFLVAAMVAWTLYVNRKLDRRYLPLVDRLNRFCEDQEEIFRLGTGKSVGVDDLLHMTTQAGLNYCHYTAMMKEALPSSRSAELSYYQGHIKQYTAEFFNSCELDSMGGVPIVYWSHRMASKIKSEWEVQMGLYPVGTASNIIDMHYSGYPEFNENLLRRINAAWAVARYRPGSTYVDELGNTFAYDLSRLSTKVCRVG